MKPTRQFRTRARTPHRFFSDGGDFQLVRSKRVHEKNTSGILGDPQGKSVNQGFWVP